MSNPHPLNVGYVAKRYPRFSETFIVNEILAHEEDYTCADAVIYGAIRAHQFTAFREEFLRRYHEENDHG